jgi:hypothetical protein
MSARIAIGALAASAFILTTPAIASDWHHVGLDVDVDLQSVQRGTTGFTAALRHTDLPSEGLPPPAKTALQHYRFDCVANTWQAIDVAYFDASGTKIGGGTYPDEKLMPTHPGSFPDMIEKLVCSGLRRG